MLNCFPKLVLSFHIPSSVRILFPLLLYQHLLICCCSVTESYPILCDPTDCIRSGFLVLPYLSEFAQTHVHCAYDAIQPSHPLPSPSPLTFSLYQHRGLFKWICSSHQVANLLVLQVQHQPFQWIFRVDFF